MIDGIGFELSPELLAIDGWEWLAGAMGPVSQRIGARPDLKQLIPAAMSVFQATCFIWNIDKNKKEKKKKDENNKKERKKAPSGNRISHVPSEEFTDRGDGTWKPCRMFFLPLHLSETFPCFLPQELFGECKHWNMGHFLVLVFVNRLVTCWD